MDDRNKMLACRFFSPVFNRYFLNCDFSWKEENALDILSSFSHFIISSIPYKDHITNEAVRAKIQQAIGPHEDLLTIVKRCKLQWYGHVSRSSGLAKTSCKAQ